MGTGGALCDVTRGPVPVAEQLDERPCWSEGCSLIPAGLLSLRGREASRLINSTDGGQRKRESCPTSAPPPPCSSLRLRLRQWPLRPDENSPLNLRRRLSLSH